MTVKQVIIIRKDLNMRRGKEIAQGAHASMQWLVSLIKGNGVPFLTDEQSEWINGDFTKVVLQCNSLQEMSKIASECTIHGLDCHFVLDKGFTEFDGKATYTALAIGPHKAELIDLITKELKLY